MKAIYFITSSIVTVSLLGLSGCSKPTLPQNDTVFNGKVQNVGKMAPHATNIKLTINKDSLHILFPNLQNNTGDNFQKSPCEATFNYLKSGENSLLETKSHLYKGTFKANNNCALFTEQPSLSYDLSSETQYVKIEQSSSGWSFQLSKDIAGKKPIIQGNIQ